MADTSTAPLSNRPQSTDSRQNKGEGRAVAVDRRPYSDVEDENVGKNSRGIRSSRLYVTFTVGYAVFVDQFVFCSTVPIAPFDLVQRSGVLPHHVQMWISIMLGVFGAGTFLVSAPWGYLSDKCKSHFWPFIFGNLVMLMALAIAWAAPNIGAQVLARFLQGASSAIIWTSGLALEVDTVGKESIGKMVGWISIGLPVGTLLATTLSGLLFEHGGYHTVYGMNLALVVVDILLRLFVKSEEHVAPRAENGFSGETSSAEQEKPADGANIGAMVADESEGMRQIPLAPAKKRPVLLRLCCSVSMVAALLGALFLGTTSASFQTVLPITVKQTFNWNAVGAGAIFLPMTLPALLGPYFGHLGDKFHQERWLAAAGFLVQCPFLILLMLIHENTMAQKVLLVFFLLMIGFAMPLAAEPVTAIMAHIADDLERKDIEDGMETGNGYYGQVYALFQLAWSAGNTLGPLWAGFETHKAGWANTSMSLGIVSGVIAIPMALCLGGWLFKKKVQVSETAA